MFLPDTLIPLKARCTPQASLGAETPYAHAITAMDSTIAFRTQSASTIARLERAIGHQRALTVPNALPGKRSVAIAGLHVILPDLTFQVGNMSPGTAVYSPKAGTLLVACADREVLSVERLQTQGRAMLRAKEWWNGVKGMGLVRDQVFRFGSPL